MSNNANHNKLDPNIFWVLGLGLITTFKAARTIIHDPIAMSCLQKYPRLVLLEFLLLAMGISCICFAIIHFKNRTNMSFWQIVICAVGSLFEI